MLAHDIGSCCFVADDKDDRFGEWTSLVQLVQKPDRISRVGPQIDDHDKWPVGRTGIHGVIQMIATLMKLAKSQNRIHGSLFCELTGERIRERIVAADHYQLNNLSVVTLHDENQFCILDDPSTNKTGIMDGLFAFNVNGVRAENLGLPGL